MSPRVQRSRQLPQPSRSRGLSSSSSATGSSFTSTTPHCGKLPASLGLPTQKRKEFSGEGSSEEDNDADDETPDNEDDYKVERTPHGGKKRSSYQAGLGKRKSFKQTPKKVRTGYNSSEDAPSSAESATVTESEDSDAIYEGVDDVSDDDEDEEQAVEKLEEQLIVSEANRESTPSSRLSLTEEWLGFDDNFEARPLYSGSLFEDNEQFLFVPDSATNEADNSVPEMPPRRVRFAESDSSESDKSSDDDILSDFMQQDELDPELRRMIENDSDVTFSRHSHELFTSQDFFDIPRNIYHVDTDESSVSFSSGYESDGGETTDEDHPPPATITHPRSLLRRDSNESLAPFEDSIKESPTRRRGPLRGTFVADPHKPVAVVAPNGTQLILIPPYASSRHDWLESAANSLSNTATNSPRQANLEDSDDTDAASPIPMLSTNANLMMAAVGSDADGQVMGPPEAFYPSRRTSDSGEDDPDDSEAILDVNDFIDFGDGSSDEDGVENQYESDALTSPVAHSAIDSATPTPNRGSEVVNSAERFLNHLDRGVVTAFRRNHSRYQALIRLPPHREFVPANSPSRPASVFRRTRFTEPKTPPPRKRPIGSYATGEAVRQKLMGSSF